MSYILTTTYPFAGGHVAAAYACGLAVTLGCSVKVQHAYSVPVSLGEMPMPLMSAEDAYTLATSQLEAGIAKLRGSFPDTDIRSGVAYGNLADVLDETAQNDPPLLTIIGNDEETDTEAWIGSNAADMLREGSSPVLAVPHASAYRKPVHVCIASDSRSMAEGASVGILLRLQQACGFRITVLHMLSDGEAPVRFPESALGRQLAASEAAYVELPASGAVDGAITGYAASHDIDWLVVIPHHYGFWQGLFHKSHTTQVLHMAHLPVLALH